MSTIKVTNLKNENFAGDQLYFKSDGKIGIGTADPSHPLHVKSTTSDLLQLDCNDAGALGAHLKLNHDSSSPADDDVVGAIEFNGKDSNGNPTIYSRIRGVALDVTDGSEDGALVFGTRVDASFGERMRINGGNVGIGTSSPSEQLHINSAATTNGLLISSTNNNTRAMMELNGKDSSGNQVELRLGGFGDTNRGEIYTVTNHDVGFATNNAAPQMVLKTSGNVGIGTISPSELLDVEGTIECLNELRSKTGNDLNLNAGSDNRDIYLNVNDVSYVKLEGSTGLLRLKRGNNNTVDIDALKGSYWGYSTGTYAGTQVGKTGVATNATIFMGVDVTGNTNGSFTGDGREIVFRNNIKFIIPNAANDGYLNPITLNAGAATEGVPRFKQGLLFGTDTADINILDDYESGTWTPTDGSGASLTFTNVNGWYVKVGDLVTMGARFTYPTTSNTNQNKIATFPFSPGTNVFSIGGITVATLLDPMGGQGNFSGLDQSGRLRTANNSIPYNDDLSGKTVYLSLSFRTD